MYRDASRRYSSWRCSTSVGTRTVGSTGRTSISSFMSVIAATADGLAPRTR